VAKALFAAHREGVVHLDIKPDNVLLIEGAGRHDAVKVVDFGVSGALAAGGCASRVMGTPEYMAPERITADSYDHRADVYSLGAMAYEMLTGVVPLQGANASDTLEMQISRLPPRLNERVLGSRIPRELEVLVMTMLDKDPDRRPANMAEVEALLLEAQVAADLQTRWDNLPLPPMDPRRAARIARRLGRPRRRWWPAAVAAFVAVAVFASSGFGGRPHPESLSPCRCLHRPRDRPPGSPLWTQTRRWRATRPSSG
jgi:serine/threonine protein kinase